MPRVILAGEKVARDIEVGVRVLDLPQLDVAGIVDSQLGGLILSEE